MKSLLKYLKNYKLECAIAPTFKMLEALFELFVPLVMTDIIDKGIGLSDKGLVLQKGGILFLLGAIGLTCSLIAQYFAARAAIGFATGVRRDLFAKILSFSHENTDKLGTSSLITRMTNDINTVQNGVNMVLRLLMRSPFIVFGAMIMAFTINVRCAIIYTVAIPVLFVIVASITVITIPRFKKIQGSLDRLTLHIRENLSGARVVRSFDADKREEIEFDAENQNFYKLSVVTARISSILNPATLIVVNLALLVLIYNGGNLVNDGVLTNGQVVALVNYMSQILIELVKLTNLFVTINKSLAGANRISETLNIENALSDEGTKDADTLKSDTLIELHDVSFKYPGAGANSLEHISFAMKEGETIGIIGGTGCGKTTLANLLMRFYDCTEGEVDFKGTNVRDITMHSLHKNISLVPQKAQLFSGTVRSNLALGNPNASEEEMWKALEIAKADEIVKGKGGGLDYVLTEAGSNLSGGQKQRLTIARALCERGKLLILDDSSSALDYATDAKLRANLRTLHDKLSVIIISQRVVSVKDADRIIVMDDGEIAQIGTHDELLKTCEVYKEICATQDTKEETV